LKKIPLSAHPSTLYTLERALAISREAQLKTDLRLAAAINRSVAEGSKYRRIAVHLYRPHSEALGGVVGMLDFGRERLERIIESGYREAVSHSCQDSGCLV
jgi:hypothetical protein